MLEKTLVLTATERLAKHLQQLDPAAEILSLNHWLERCWKECSHHKPLLLNEIQEHTLWGNILARKAWQLLNQWELSLDILKDETAPEIQFFYRSAKIYFHKCQAHHWVDQSQLPKLLLQALDKRAFQVPKQIFLAGFDHITPAIQMLLGALNKYCSVQILISEEKDDANVGWVSELQNDNVSFQTTAVEHNDEKSKQNTAVKIALTNQQQEIRTAALWASQQLRLNSDAKIACVVPNLNQVRQEVVQIFTEVLAPESLLPQHHLNKLPFNISMGQALSSFPIIDIALLGLALDPHTNPTLTISRLLYSPFITDTDRVLHHAKLDAQLRSNFETHISMQNLPANIVKSATMATKSPNEQTPSAWAQHFTKQLEQLDWPGTRTLNSDEYQTFQRLQTLLSEFSSLDSIAPLLNRTQALDYLTDTAKRIIYQPKTEECPIQILGSLEAAGLSFDFMWVMGMDSDSWPPPANPNPFLPIHLQKRLNMPQASAKQQLDFTRKLTQRLQQENTHIVFSYAKLKDDQDLTPSHLIYNLPEISLAELALPADISYTQQIYQASKIETITDSYGPQVSDNEYIRGGTNILKKQAVCPFKAFAEHRLHATELTPLLAGLHPMERGQILHSVLEGVWHHLIDHQRLCTLEQKIIDQAIFTSIDKVLNNFRARKPYTFKKHFIAIERQRLFYLLKKWLDVEKLRQPFTVIAKEYRQQTKLNYLTMNLQIDRIDELEDGSKIIIDYKTGTASVSDWFGERPNEPQLPLYCVTHPTTVEGIMFAQMRSNRMHFSGLVKDEAYCFTGMKNSVYQKEMNPESWKALQEKWKIIFLNLEKDFYHGLAIVDPKNGKQTCEKCTLQTFCRIAEKT